MSQIILIRHAKALNRSTALHQGIKEAQRPLTQKGRLEFIDQVKNNKAIFKNVELYITSPYFRALETLAVLHEVLPERVAPIKTIRQICPDAKTKFLEQLLKKRNEKKIVIVSHEPFLSNFLARILNSGSAKKPLQKIRKGAIIILDKNPTNHQYKLIKFINP